MEVNVIGIYSLNVTILIGRVGNESTAVPQSKGRFRWLVKKAVEKVALEQLQLECSLLKKTSNLRYEELKLQPYLSKLYPSQSRIIFKMRSRTLDIKIHSTYKYTDQLCRRCGGEDETVEHILNCGRDGIVSAVDVSKLEDVDASTKTKLIAMTYRIEDFAKEFGQ